MGNLWLWKFGQLSLTCILKNSMATHTFFQSFEKSMEKLTFLQSSGKYITDCIYQWSTLNTNKITVWVFKIWSTTWLINNFTFLRLPLLYNFMSTSCWGTKMNTFLSAYLTIYTCTPTLKIHITDKFCPIHLINISPCDKTK